ncbi:DNA polymerase Y family protein [Alteromonas sp. D210916BOD_24]|uniref:Y-family DNA polymerase n=1 Tax=Alteromonas sp. D210916BOD_24 TaxID=3157618 RepID=UPI00399D12C0
MLWLYLHCYQLTLDAYLREGDPSGSAGTTLVKQSSHQAANNAVVVYCNKHNRVMQCNHDARQAGIEIGYGLAQTAALCPHVHILPFCEDDEKSLLTQLAHRLYPLASDIVLESSSGLAVRLDNLTHYYGGHHALWQTLKHELLSTQTHFNFASAWSIEAAKVLALHKANTYFATPEKIKHTLALCSLTLTALPSKIIDALLRVGVRHIHQLLNMPVHELGRRFDNNTITYLTALRGEVVPRVTLFRPSAHYDNALELPFEIESAQHLLPFITRQLEDLSHYLRARNLNTTAVVMQICFRETDTLSLTIHSALPQSSTNSWLSLITLKIENLVLPAPAVGIALKCNQFEDVDGDSHDFFSNRFNEIAQKQLIGRLNAKLGESSTFQPSTVDSHQFEYMTTHMAAQTSAYASDVTPTLIFEKPQPLTQATHICFGPIRLNSEWWHNTSYTRDYFIAQTEQGARLLVFKDEASKWWALGVFC